MPKPIQLTGIKVCRTCGKEKPIEDFYFRNKKTMIRHSSCKECDIIRVKKRYEENPDKVKHNECLRKYGITLEERNKMYENQNGVCVICKKSGDGRWDSLCVDHNHSTGKVRELLCRNCNMVLGQIGDNINVLEEMIKYLQKHQ